MAKTQAEYDKFKEYKTRTAMIDNNKSCYHLADDGSIIFLPNVLPLS
jgi:hypothetical protein